MSTTKDWSANERRLQSSYDDISAGKYKLALQEVDRFLKKTPGSQPALVLRAFLLNKLGHSTEDVLKVWQAVEKTGELSPRSMWFAQLLMRNIGRSDILLNLCVKLWEARPDSTELGHQVVTLSTACWDTAVMCSSSRRMFNLSKTATWARVAAWAEWANATSSQTIPEHGFPSPAPANSLRTATVLLSTTRKDVPSSEILWLQVQILLGAGQEDEAIALVRKEGVGGGGIARNWWRLKTLHEVMRRVEERGDLERLKRIVRDELDDFTVLMKGSDDMQRNFANYDHIIRLVASSPDHINVISAQDTFRHLHRILGNKERAPALALLRLDASLRKAAVDMSTLMGNKAYLDSFEAYWRANGTKGVIVDDLAGQWKGRESLLATPLASWAEEDHSNVDQYLAVKHARLLLFKLKADGWKPTEEDFQTTWKCYQSGGRYGIDLPDTDVRPADDIGIAAVQILLHLWSATRDERHLFRAVLCLRQICQDSPSSAHARYMLIRVCRLLGAPSLVVAPLEQLKLAEIQLDTLLHIVTERSSVDLPLGRLSAVIDLYRDRVEAMYSRTATDLPEYMKQALENESYSQIHSIRTLRCTLSKSLPCAMLAIEAQQTALVSKEKAPPQLPTELRFARDADDGQDTRDWALMPTLVGSRPIQGVISLSDGINRDWISAWRRVLRGVEEVGLTPNFEVDSGRPSTEDMSPAERAAVEEMWQVVKVAHTAFTASTSQDMDDLKEALASLEDIGNANIKFVKDPVQSRWQRLHNIVLLLQLVRVLKILYTRAIGHTTAKARTKKAAPAVPSVVSLAQALKAAMARIGQDLVKFAPLFEGAAKADEELDWAELNSGLVEDDLARMVGKDIVEARKMAMDNLRRLVKVISDDIGKK